jgi:hypothetical protein
MGPGPFGSAAAAVPVEPTPGRSVDYCAPCPLCQHPDAMWRSRADQKTEPHAEAVLCPRCGPLLQPGPARVETAATVRPPIVNRAVDAALTVVATVTASVAARLDRSA